MNYSYKLKVFDYLIEKEFYNFDLLNGLFNFIIGSSDHNIKVLNKFNQFLNSNALEFYKNSINELNS